MSLIDTLHQLDIDIFRALNHAGEVAIIDAVMVAFTIMGMVYVIALVAIPLWTAGKRDVAFDVVVLVVIVSVLTEIIKFLVDRQRPYLELSGVQTILSASGPSFPSAHASRAFAVAFIIALNSRRMWGILGIVVASLIAVSRVYLGVHWPSDILFGALLGLLVAALMAYVGRECEGYRGTRRRVTEGLRSVQKRGHAPMRSASDKAVET